MNALATVSHFHASMVKWCSMHTINLGCLQYLLGSVVELLVKVYLFFGHGSFDERLLELTQRFKTWALANAISHSQGTLTRGMIYHSKEGSEYPMLTLKAYNGRVMLVFLTRCLQILYRDHSGDPEVGLAWTACQRLCAFFDLMERTPRYLSHEDAQELHAHGQRFVELYFRLAKLGVQQNILRYKLVPKFHILAYHLLPDMLRNCTNIRSTHCFIDEDCMGTLKALARRVHPRLLEIRVLCRWQLRLKIWRPSRKR